MRVSVLLVVLVSVHICGLFGKDSLIVIERMSAKQLPISLVLSYGQAWNSVMFKQLPLVESCCTEFTGSVGPSWGVAASYMVARMSDQLSLSAAGGLTVAVSDMRTVTKEIVDFRGDAYDALIGHDLSMQYWNAALEVVMRYEPLPWLAITAGAGFTVPVALKYSLSESIVDPSELVFETGSSVRNQTSGTSPSAASALYIPVRIEGPGIDLGRHVRAYPNVSFRSWMTSVNADTDWGLNTFEAGVRFAFIERERNFDTLVIKTNEQDNTADTVVTPPDIDNQQLFVVAGVRDSVTNTLINSVEFTFNVKRRRLAVLPAVFFDSASAVVPDRFRQKREIRERIDNVRDIDVNHSIIHLLANTMMANPDATVVLTGSHADDVQPSQRESLARDRAQSVMGILITDYGIDKRRFRVKTRVLPERPSSVFTPFGREENRRVDIELSGSLYNLPVQVDTIPVLGPSEVDVEISMARPETVANVQIDLLVDGFQVDSFKFDASDLRRDTTVLTLTLTDGVRRSIVSSKVVELLISVQDNEEGVLSQRLRAFDVSSRLDEQQPYDEFGIVLFDYNSSVIAATERLVINELKSRVKGTSYVKITGTSDESGDEAYNLRLAGERAKSVARSLGLRDGDFELESKIATEYSSDFPEGRQLGRQVKVVLKTGEK